MNSTHSMPSPVSPYNQHSKQTFSASRQQYYPATPNPELMSPQHQQQPQQQEQVRGLGLYPGSMPPSHQSTISPMMGSPQSDWSHSSHHMEQAQQQPEYSTSQPPDIFSAAFDPFSGFSASSNTGMVGPGSPEAPGLEYCHTPPSSNMLSHRGSISSSVPSEHSEAYTPRAKGEEAGGEWYPTATSEMHRSIALAPISYGPGAATLASQTEDILYRPQPAEWSKSDTSGYITELHSSTDGRLPPLNMQPVLPSVTRIKKKRQRTTPEEATHECRVCGKLFKRSYNWKSHMETHNPERKYPHPCTHMVGSSPCAKKFQRKTDLDRHVDSVHLKARNHKCNLCGNRFARRDTLRRHTEDGCPKRFELGIRDGSATPATAPPPAQRWSFPSPQTGFAPRPRSYSQTAPMAPPPVSSSAAYPIYSAPAPAYHL